jgi:ribulose-phosphate 3-epimerase
MAKAIIAPSVLAANFAKLGEESADLVQKGADWLHLDVMDGHLVPNISFGPVVVKALRGAISDVFFDCHLMVSDPAFWIDSFKDAGASQICFHVEAYNDPKKTRETIDKIHALGMKAGLALRPNTMASAVFPFTDVLDMVLVMSVEPGFGGQKFMPQVLPKVQELRQRCPALDIQIDGGVDGNNIQQAADAGANVIVAGTSIVGAPDRKAIIDKMRTVVDAAIAARASA